MHNASLLTGLKIRSVLLLAGICFLMFFWQLGEVPFYVRGEPREGLVVQAMQTSSDWVLPLMNGKYIPFKPPLFHWIAVLIAKALGRVDEFTLRFPSALFAALGVFLTYLAGARLWEEKAGMVAAVVLATSHEWWKAGSLAQVDMTLAFFMVAAFLLFLFVYRERNQGVGILGPLVIALLLACAALAKGPVGVVIPLLVFFCFLALRHHLAFLKKLHLLPSAALFCLVAGSWYLLALQQGGEGFFLRQIVNENLRTVVGSYGHYHPPFYFLPALFLNMAPWSLFLPSIAFFAYQERRWLSDERVLYLLVWFVTVFLFFSLARGKRTIYILPLYPAAALLFGAWWVELAKEKMDRLWFARAAGYLAAAFCLIVPGVFLIRLLGWDIFDAIRSIGQVLKHDDLFLVLDSLESPSWLVWTCLILAGAAGLVLVRALVKKRWDVIVVSLVVGAIATGLMIKQVYYPALAAERTLKPFMTRVRSAVEKEGAPLYFYRLFDYGAVFYTGRHVHEYPERAPFPKPPGFLLMWDEEWERIPESSGLERLDISRGTGAATQHHMVLVKVKDTAPVLQGKAVLPD
jgi:4-amino-4-deoxy-L-arabinose transferase-like glycosyltransferase